MIVGVGMDLCEVDRIDAMLTRWGERFTRKLFTPGEIAFATERVKVAQHLAARFAAKEATLKALAVPVGLQWHELEVVGGGGRPPRLVLGGRAAEVARELGVARLHLTLTHTVDVAAAFVVAEGGPHLEGVSRGGRGGEG
jgi:holo-[acyl-carrier protein] synthase